MKIWGKDVQAPFKVASRLLVKLKYRRYLIKSRRYLLKSRRYLIKSRRYLIVFRDSIEEPDRYYRITALFSFSPHCLPRKGGQTVRLCKVFRKYCAISYKKCKNIWRFRRKCVPLHPLSLKNLRKPSLRVL